MVERWEAGGGIEAVALSLRKSTAATRVYDLGNGLFLKDETDNPARCFKLRSMVRLALWTDASTRVVTTASSGNTGLALGIAAQGWKIPALVWMQEGSPVSRIRQVERTGAAVRVEGQSFSESANLACRYANRNGGSFVSPGRPGPFADGHQQIFREVISSHPEVKSIFVPAGGGGLLAAAVAVCKGADGRVPRLVGVQARASQPLVEIFHGRTPSATPAHVSYAECLSGDIEPDAAILSAMSGVDDLIGVSRSELRAADDLIRTRTGLRPEPGASAGVAAALREDGLSPRLAILTGARRPKIGDHP